MSYPLRIHLLGPFEVYREGQPITTSECRSLTNRAKYSGFIHLQSKRNNNPCRAIASCQIPRPVMLGVAYIGHHLMESRMLRGIKQRVEA
jgi:hypothetical protein